MEAAPPPPHSMLRRILKEMRTLPPLPWNSLPQHCMGGRGGARRKLSKTVDAAARKTGTHTKSHTFCANFRLSSYFPFATKSIHNQQGDHSHPTASGITKMPTNGGYLKNGPILGSPIRAQIELFEKLYEAFKAEYLKTVQMIQKQLKPVKARSSEV